MSFVTPPPTLVCDDPSCPNRVILPPDSPGLLPIGWRAVRYADQDQVLHFFPSSCYHKWNRANRKEGGNEDD